MRTMGTGWLGKVLLCILHRIVRTILARLMSGPTLAVRILIPRGLIISLGGGCLRLSISRMRGSLSWVGVSWMGWMTLYMRWL